MALKVTVWYGSYEHPLVEYAAMAILSLVIKSMLPENGDCNIAVILFKYNARKRTRVMKKTEMPCT